MAPSPGQLPIGHPEPPSSPAAGGIEEARRDAELREKMALKKRLERQLEKMREGDEVVWEGARCSFDELQLRRRNMQTEMYRLTGKAKQALGLVG